MTLYQTDFYAWTQQQAALLQAEEFTEVDWQNLIEEIEELGSSCHDGKRTN
jgi:N-acetylglutamate synthase-like GNAT family acetyltransferase